MAAARTAVAPGGTLNPANGRFLRAAAAIRGAGAPARRVGRTNRRYLLIKVRETLKYY
jgi:hypothetical protein